MWIDERFENFSIEIEGTLTSWRESVVEKGYKGDPRVRTPYDAIDKDHKREISLGRSQHEIVNCRIKQFGALQGIWRHGNEKY